MKTKTVLALFAALCCALLASATPIKISNEDAFALFGALQQIQPGLTASNVGAAAEDIWALKGIAEAFQSAQVRAARDAERSKAAKDPLAANEAVQADFDKYRMAEIVVELQPITISDDELKEAKITPAILAPILHYLKPPAKK